MHWHKDTITVHSGIFKTHGQKSCHPYLSNDKCHNQKFVNVVLKEMIESVSTIPQLCIIKSRVSPSGGTGGTPPLPKKLACPPPCPLTVLTQKCQFYHFHAVFDHFAQIVPPPVDPIWETLKSDNCGAQYMSAEQFDDIQSLEDHFNNQSLEFSVLQVMERGR